VPGEALSHFLELGDGGLEPVSHGWCRWPGGRAARLRARR
jgi:hypothetical protein